MVNQVAVIPRRSMPLLEARSDRAGALSGMEWALTVLRWKPHTPGPGLRLTSPAIKKRKSQNQAGPGVVAAFLCCHKGKEMELIPKLAKGHMI